MELENNMELENSLVLNNESLITTIKVYNFSEINDDDRYESMKNFAEKKLRELIPENENYENDNYDLWENLHNDNQIIINSENDLAKTIIITFANYHVQITKIESIEIL